VTQINLAQINLALGAEDASRTFLYLWVPAGP
jgi:hypothetical protein